MNEKANEDDNADLLPRLSPPVTRTIKTQGVLGEGVQPSDDDDDDWW
jgi:hypothetical protein